jgi:hypothetical protein
MRARIFALPLLLGLAWLQSCSFHNIDDDVKPQDINPCDTMAVSYADTIQVIITRNCGDPANGSCHFPAPAGNGIDFTTYAGIKAKVDEGKVFARVFDRVPSQMPPDYSNGPRALSDCEQILLRRWIDAGAPNN